VITYPLPLSFLDGFPGWSTSFELAYRQEQSRTANGRTVVKDLGSPLWTMSVQSRSLSINELDEWRARLESLENGLKTFRAFSKSRCYPIAYPNGSWPTGGAFGGQGTLYAVNENRKAVMVSAFPVGFRLSVGDLIQIGPANLHRVMEAATVDGTGRSPEFEVRPHLWPASAVNDPVLVKQPSCVMAIVPGSISSQADLTTGRGVISFQAMEAR
jgi:hypothetical protein